MHIYWDERGVAPLNDQQYTLLASVIEAGLDMMSTRDSGYNYEVSVSFVSCDEILELNRQYRGMDKVTDVLSFPAIDEKGIAIAFIADDPAESPPIPLGDIVICMEAAAIQAEEYGHSFERELSFLTVHGLLHLLGFDHEDAAEEDIMCGIQEEILGKVGITR